MTEGKKYKTFANTSPVEAPRGTMKGLRAVKPTESSASVPEYRTTEVPDPTQSIESKEQIQSTTEVPNYRSTAVPESHYYKKANEAADRLDRHLTPAESKVFEQIVRLTVGFQMDERQVRISVIKERTGYGSDKTVRIALQGLERKGVIARIGKPNNSGGITYRILSYSGTPLPRYRSTPVEVTAVLGSKTTGELKTDLKRQNTDDEAFAGLVLKFKEAVHDITGREVTVTELNRWTELAQLLITELKIAAGRTDVSSVPAFLTEHLRRRLWKKDRHQVEEEGKSPAGGHRGKVEVDASQCPDCFGTGMWYPEGFEKDVARCRHEKLAPKDSE